MQRRKTIDVHRVFAGDGQLDIAIVKKRAAEDARLDAKIVATEGLFDRDFPEACGAEDQFILSIVEMLARASRIDPEESGNFTLAHAVEVARDFDLAFQKTKTLRLCWGTNRGDFHQRFACLGDDERFPAGCALDKPGELGLRLVNVDSIHTVD